LFKIIENGTIDRLHCVSKKLCIFISVITYQISTDFNKFWYLDGKVVEIACCINIFHLTCPTSPPCLLKLRCSKLLHNVFATNYLTTELAHNKLKYGSFSRVISPHDRLAQNCQNLCSKCAPYTDTSAIDDDTSLASLSLQEIDSVACLMCQGAVLLKHKKIVSRQPANV